MRANPKLEADFVRLYLKTGDAVDAVTRSGLLNGTVDPRDTADELLAEPRIQELIASTKAPELRRPSELTKESIISDYERVFGAAMLKEDYGNAIAAKKNQAAIMGFAQENVQVTHRMDVTRMTDEQIEKILEKRLKKIEPPMIDITPTPIGLGSQSVGK